MSKNITVNKPPDRTVVVPERRVQVVEIGAQTKLGPKGDPGSKILSGDGPPTSDIGIDGDFYVDTTANGLPLYGPKSGGIWPTVVVYSNLNERYVHDQPSVSSVWTINHPLGGFPSVTVVDSAQTVVVGEVSYPNTSQVMVNFSAPFSGKAFLT